MALEASVATNVATTAALDRRHRCAALLGGMGLVISGIGLIPFFLLRCGFRGMPGLARDPAEITLA
jgi:hypothetical protein